MNYYVRFLVMKAGIWKMSGTQGGMQVWMGKGKDPQAYSFFSVGGGAVGVEAFQSEWMPVPVGSKGVRPLTSPAAVDGFGLKLDIGGSVVSGTSFNQANVTFQFMLGTSYSDEFKWEGRCSGFVLDGLSLQATLRYVTAEKKARGRDERFDPRVLFDR
jgi:hypothetical protein